MQRLAIAADEIVIPTPTTSMISSFCSYNRLVLRGGVNVGSQNLQHIYDFAEGIELTPEAEDHDVCCIDCVIDSDRAEAFFAIVLTTKKLLTEFNSSKPIETDETYKVMHEGYGLTLIGQSDSNRVWHVRYIILSHPAFQ